MSLSIGILGLPNVGKSTLFKALTSNPVDISNYPFCTIEPNVGIVEVADERLDKLAQVSKPEKVIPAVIKFVDVAGLARGASKGEGLGNQFLAHLRETHALLHVVRGFKHDNIVHVEGDINPQRDIQTIREEIIIKDKETVKKRMEKIEKDVKQGIKGAKQEYEVLSNFKPGDNIPNLLSSKPEIIVLNGNSKEYFSLDFKEELDKTELSEDERKELEVELGLDKLIAKCYEILDLITFFTIVGNKEARAWPIKKGSNILDGAEMVHSDFKDKFVRAEVLNWKQVVDNGSYKACKEKGLLKTVGKDYMLEDGDVLEIKI